MRSHTNCEHLHACIFTTTTSKNHQRYKVHKPCSSCSATIIQPCTYLQAKLVKINFPSCGPGKMKNFGTKVGPERIWSISQVHECEFTTCDNTSKNRPLLPNHAPCTGFKYRDSIETLTNTYTVHELLHMQCLRHWS